MEDKCLSLGLVEDILLEIFIKKLQIIFINYDTYAEFIYYIQYSDPDWLPFSINVTLFIHNLENEWAQVKFQEIDICEFIPMCYHSICKSTKYQTDINSNEE